MGDRRRWTQFLVLGVAAFASLATSKRKGWTLEANLARDTPGTSRIAFVEASKQPDVRLDNGELVQPLAGVYTGMWNGTARYLIPADRTLASVTISGGCGGGMCASGDGCEPPAGELVKLLSVKPVGTWRIEKTTQGEVEADIERTEIAVGTSQPIQFELTAPGRYHHETKDPKKVVIHWAIPVEGLSRSAWTLRVFIEGVCDSEAACEPPKGARVDLGTIDQVKYRTGSGK